MTALSLGLNVRGDGFQMVHYRGCGGGPLSISGVKRLSLPTFFAAAKKVGAAPHRGNANRPLRTQGKANKKSQKTQNGVAIISALLVVALSAILVSGMLWRQQVQIRRIENQRLLSQAQWVSRGALDWTRLILRSEGDTSAGITYLGGLWGVPIAKTRLSDFLGQIGEVRAQQGAETYLSGSIEDAQAKFNLRNLVESPAPGVMQLDMDQIGAYQRLLASLGANSQLAKTTARRVRASLAQSATRFQTVTSTNGTTATPPPIQGGATGGNFTDKPGIEDSEDSEDSDDSSANAPIQMTSVDSLLDIPGYTPEMVARLRPFVTVLPTVSAVNVNTASAEVIAAVIPGMSVSTAQAFVARRQTVFFRNVGDIQLALQGAGVPSISIDPSELDVNSNYFLIHGRVQHERAEVDRTTLVYRDALTHTTRIVRVEDQL
ncbi:type II secretion system minor pseudopilin GspK [Paraburkholderia xenovorans]|uniref:type II secretion system minor pseudopilin GspK n=1 Tax=Paraburkholderia xenovorans TaxID=36873 RepID=UPI0038BBF31E